MKSKTDSTESNIYVLKLLIINCEGAVVSEFIKNNNLT